MPLPYDPTNPVYDNGTNQGNPNPPGYNNPWYDPQRQSQLGDQGYFQPTPQQVPTYTDGTNWGNVFGAAQNAFGQGGATTQPTYNPDVFGSGGYGGGGGGYNWNNVFPDIKTYPGYAGTDPQDPGIPIDKYGHEIPNPYGPLPPLSYDPTYGKNAYGIYQTGINNSGGSADYGRFNQQIAQQGGITQSDVNEINGFLQSGQGYPSDNPYYQAYLASGGKATAQGGGMVRDPQTGQMVQAYNGPSASQGPDLFNNPIGQGSAVSGGSASGLGSLPQPTGQQGQGQSSQQSDIQRLLEDPNGPYANRKPGDYGPIGSPDYVLNPQTQQDWIARYNWFQQNPTAFTTGYTQPRDLSAQQYDYSKPNSVPYTAFLNNAYADTNAKQGFKELSGVLTPDQLRQAQQMAGWQDAVSGFNADANQVYQRMDQEARANPGVDYEVVRVAQPDGSIAYGLQKREQSQQAQEARGFFAPGSTNPNSPANVAAAQARARTASASRPVSSLPRPGGTGTGGGGGGIQWPQQNFSIDKYQIPADKNPYNLLTQPGRMGETVSYGGDVYTYNGVTWVKQSATVVPPNGGGGGGGKPAQYQPR